MKDYDDLALFRRKSGNAHFELRPVSDPSLPAGKADEAAMSRLPATQQGSPRQVVVPGGVPGSAAASPTLSLATATQEQEMRARRARLAGLFRRPEPLPASRSTSSGTLLRPLLRRIAAQSRPT